MSHKQRVFVGLSGGVDSSVSAVLLQEAGYDVTGVFIQGWYPDWMECSWRDDRLDAMRVAVKLGIPFVTLNLEKEYKKEVVDYMVSGYRAGRTPNPDIMCNKYVKFGAFLDWALTQGADYVATGHYSQVLKNLRMDGYDLVAGRDKSKDQSYFLWTLTREQLSHTLFPIGHMQKSEVRKLAKKYDLPTADKGDSQGVCFMGDVDVAEFLSHYIPKKRGDVLDESDRVIGWHDGAVFLTLGVRHGFTVTEKTPDDKPYYIISRNTKKNTITVSHRAPDGTLSSEKKEFSLSSTHWIGDAPESGKRYMARVRHLGELMPCMVELVNKEEAEIGFGKPLTIARGQSVVVYDGDICLGGGIVL
jgi:tRNA-specific 2-thiouridylase